MTPLLATVEGSRWMRLIRLVMTEGRESPDVAAVYRQRVLDPVAEQIRQRARHANPWSVWTRVITTMPLLVAGVWSQTWLGAWSLIPIAVALGWIWFNPRAFGPARDDHAWISKYVLGERFWANRKESPVPERHRRLPNVLNIASLAGFPFLIWGLARFELWPTVLGMTVITGAKLWYIDRMAILYDDMVQANPQLRYRRP